MQVLTLLGSPRDDGNTARLLTWLEEQFVGNGHNVERVWLAEARLDGCQECFACRTGRARYCSIADGADQIFEQMTEADAVVFASPVFCWGFPAQMKALIDRTFCLVGDFHANPDYKSRLTGKPLALLLTSGGPPEDNTDLVTKAFEGLVRFHKALLVGKLVVPNCTQPEALGNEAREMVQALGCQIELCVRKWTSRNRPEPEREPPPETETSTAPTPATSAPSGEAPAPEEPNRAGPEPDRDAQPAEPAAEPGSPDAESPTSP